MQTSTSYVCHVHFFALCIWTQTVALRCTPIVHHYHMGHCKQWISRWWGVCCLCVCVFPQCDPGGGDPGSHSVLYEGWEGPPFRRYHQGGLQVFQTGQSVNTVLLHAFKVNIFTCVSNLHTLVLSGAPDRQLGDAVPYPWNRPFCPGGAWSPPK